MTKLKLAACLMMLMPIGAHAQDAGYAVFCPAFAQAAEKNGGTVPVPLPDAAAIYKKAGFKTKSNMFKAMSGAKPLDDKLRSGIESFLADKCGGNLKLD